MVQQGLLPPQSLIHSSFHHWKDIKKRSLYLSLCKALNFSCKNQLVKAFLSDRLRYIRLLYRYYLQINYNENAFQLWFIDYSYFNKFQMHSVIGTFSPSSQISDFDYKIEGLRHETRQRCYASFHLPLS